MWLSPVLKKTRLHLRADGMQPRIGFTGRKFFGRVQGVADSLILVLPVKITGGL
jgi:hypothetical protein